MASLKIIEGPGGGKELTLTENVTLGRWRGCDLQIKDEEASREHSEIFLRAGRYHVRDLGSSNGTFVNGEKVTEELLRPGDLIRIGGVTIEYVDEETENGDDDTKVQVLAVLESMKMQMQVRAPFAGRVTRVNAVAGAQVEKGTLLVRIGEL